MDRVASATAQRPPGWELLRPCCWVESGSCQEEWKENPREALSKATSQTEVDMTNFHTSSTQSWASILTVSLRASQKEKPNRL